MEYKVISTKYAPESMLNDWGLQGYEVASVSAGVDGVHIVMENTGKASSDYVHDYFTSASTAKSFIDQKLAEGYLIDGVGIGQEFHIVGHLDRTRVQEYDIVEGNWMDVENFLNAKFAEGFKLDSMDGSSYEWIVATVKRYK